MEMTQNEWNDNRILMKKKTGKKDKDKREIKANSRIQNQKPSV